MTTAYISTIRRMILPVGLALACASVHATDINYNFDNLQTGNLTTGNTSGQGGWYRDAALGGPDIQVIAAPSGSPTSQALSVAYGSTHARAILQSGENFFDSNAQQAEISFTFQKTLLTVNYSLALGNGAEPTSYINGNSQSNLGFRFGLSGGNQFNIQPKAENGNFGTVSASAAQVLTNGDWYKVTLSIDFAANSGDGAASLSYTNLSTSQTFSDVLTNINLGLTNNPAGNQAQDWNQVWLRMNQLGSGGTPADTLMFSGFSVVSVPEPATTAMLSMAAVAFVTLAIRRTRNKR